MKEENNGEREAFEAAMTVEGYQPLPAGRYGDGPYRSVVYEAGWTMWQAALASRPAEPQPKIALNLSQAQQLVELFGGEDSELTLAVEREGWDGPGLYAHYTEYPEEGAHRLDRDRPLIVAAEPAVEPRAVGLSDEQIDQVLSEAIGFDQLTMLQHVNRSDLHRVVALALAAASPQPGAETEPVAYMVRSVRYPKQLGILVHAFEIGSYQRATVTRQPLYATAPAPAVSQGLSDEAADRLKADANSIFNDPPAETAQEVRDVIEWYDASLRTALPAVGRPE